jgi:hypothetical protein
VNCGFCVGILLVIGGRGIEIGPFADFIAIDPFVSACDNRKTLQMPKG